MLGRNSCLSENLVISLGDSNVFFVVPSGVTYDDYRAVWIGDFYSFSKLFGAFELKVLFSYSVDDYAFE